MDMKSKSAATPSANEVAVIKEILNTFETNKFSYKQAKSLLPHVQDALEEIAFNHAVRNQYPQDLRRQHV
ncbi:hypothetical protein [Sporosarcina newyorkensis]|uniref:hypothetical protein n=1 Tax=Sporosarcina newyorkensis TaxID=759851 RepID=UPI003CFCE690